MSRASTTKTEGRGSKASPASSVVLSKEAQAQLSRWPATAQRLLTELLEDAASDLQRELLQRAVAAGHTPNEVHAFADQLRAMGDDDAFTACTLDESAPSDYTVAQLLRAEADPLYAFELKGGTLEPSDDEVPLAKPPPPVDLNALKRRPSSGFVADSNDVGPLIREEPTFTRRPAAASEPHAPFSSGGTPSAMIEDVFSEATRALGLEWQESEVDVPGGLSLETAISDSAVALSEGLPVPLALGAAPGKSGRLVLAIQLSVSGHNRAWQLYDPFSNELVWANERDLLNRNELPFSNKVFRRVTRVVLPSRRR